MALGNGTVKVSWVPGAISWPACCAAAGYQISQGNRRSRTVSSPWMARTPTGNRPRTNGSYSDVTYAIAFGECSFACLRFSSVIKTPLLRTCFITTLTEFLNVSHKTKHATLGRWYNTARVSKRLAY